MAAEEEPEVAAAIDRDVGSIRAAAEVPEKSRCTCSTAVRGSIPRRIELVIGVSQELVDVAF